MRICVVGLGYVGLPLAVAFSRKHEVTGFDTSGERIEELLSGRDSSGEVAGKDLAAAKVRFTSDPKEMRGSEFIVVAVPTPVTKANVPDMACLRAASRLVGENLTRGSIVVYESTVYPGATEEVCIPILENCSRLVFGRDFSVGYSPERMNPGDREHTVENIVKVVSGSDPDTLRVVADTYRSIIRAGVYEASSIRVAEAAKVIENIQRDLNIALMNELSLIFSRIGISTKEVLDAAATKWNFHRYSPGLVGGHCIGVDPYYLTYKAQELGYQPQIILAGRSINESMARHVAGMVIRELGVNSKPLNKCRVLCLGLTFKEDVPDTRNSKAGDVIRELLKYHVQVIACDPLLDAGAVKQEFGIENMPVKGIPAVDACVMISPHAELLKLGLPWLKELMPEKPVLIDVKSCFARKKAEAMHFTYRAL